ncbi:MAG: hypothetical protein OXF50_24345 [Caldilineaceae bacterium]|nr:hypothetical protein [Caldilineaceae bacterium]
MTKFLFDNIKRSPLCFENMPESSFQCLNQFDWPDGVRLRRNLETWFKRFPASEQKDLRGKFRSDSNQQHEGAFFELFLHELITRLGFATSAHPVIAGVKTHPDFLICHEGRSLYLEATMVGQRSGPFTRSPNEQNVIDSLNTLCSPYFYIGVHMEGELKTTLRGKDVTRPFENLLVAHDPVDVQRLFEEKGMYSTPSERIECGDWSLEGWLYPISPESREKGNRRQDIVIEPYRATWTDSVTPVRRVLKKKASHYGNLNLPFVVAVNCRDVFYNGRDNDMDVLFGKEQLLYSVVKPDLPPEIVREPDGVWPRHSKIDAVMIFQKVDLGNLQNASVCLYLNPNKHSDSALPNILFRLPHAKGCDGDIQWFKGEAVADLVGMS